MCPVPVARSAAFPPHVFQAWIERVPAFSFSGPARYIKGKQAVENAGRHSMRFANGSHWTIHVAEEGARSA